MTREEDYVGRVNRALALIQEIMDSVDAIPPSTAKAAVLTALAAVTCTLTIPSDVG